MIYGVGTDVVEIARIEQALERFGERFARRILCGPELKRFRSHRLPGVRELHIGHAIVSRSVFVGMREAVREMKRLITDAAR